jgi:MFS family permease
MFGGAGPVWALLLGITTLALGNGLQSSLVGIRAAAENFDTTTTGFIMSGYSIGLIVSSFLVPRLVTYVGHVRVFAALASVVSTVVLFIPLWIDPFFWFAIRVVAGLCTSGLYIVCESWLNAAATNQSRGRLLSVYMTLTYSALGAGQLLLNVSDESGFARFILVSAIFSMALVPISLVRIEPPSIERARGVSILDIYRASPTATVAIFACGAGQSAFFSMGAVFGFTHGMPLGYISLMMALPPIAVILSQYPVGAASDLFDRRTLLVILSFLAAAIAALMFLIGDLSHIVLIALMAAFGAAALPLYSLVLAYANDNLHKDQMLAASSKLILLYGLGAMLGPLLVGEFMRRLGPLGFMTFLVLLYGGIAGFALYRQLRRPAVPPATGAVAQVPPETTGVTARALAEDQAAAAK